MLDGIWIEPSQEQLQALAEDNAKLPNFHRPATELRNDLERWLFFLRHGDQLDPAHLPNTPNVSPITSALGELSVLTHDELERERYESRRQKLLDETSVRNEYQRGLQQALEQGIEKGRAEGLIANIRFAQRLLNQPLMPVEQLHSQSIDELQRLADGLKEQALSR